VRSAVRAIKPDAVVISETTSGPMGRHVDGGLSADLADYGNPKDSLFPWLKNANQGRILASPVRYGMPRVNFFSNGRNLGELHQVYAAGHNLALCSRCLPKGSEQDFMTAHADHIRQLLDQKRNYKDALIYGNQQYQPQSSQPDV